MKILSGVGSLLCFCLSCNLVYGQKKALAPIDSMKAELIGMKADTSKVRAIYHITNAYLDNQPDSALAYAKQGLALAKKLKWKKGIGPFYNVLGNLYSDQGKYDLARQYYVDAYQISKKMDNKHNMASNLNNIGSQYQRQGNYVKALDYTLKALTIAESSKNVALTATFQNNIGAIYFGQKDYEKSLIYHNKSLTSFTQQGDDNGIAKVDMSIANIYYEQKKLTKAGLYYNNALALYRKTGNKLGEATVLAQMGLLYDDDPVKKISYLLPAQKIFDELYPLHTTSITNIGNIGGTYADVIINHKAINPQKNTFFNGDRDKIIKAATYYLNKAISYAKQVGDTENLSTFADNLAQLQEKMGDYANALQNYKQSRTIDDSMYSQASKNKIADLSARYAFQKKESEYKQQQQISSLKMKQTVLYATLLIVLITGILIFFLNRSRISQLKLKNELERKEAEEKTRELLHRNKLSESELKAIRAQMNPHFIFNVLNSIESYILENDSKTASKLVQKFASLSRLILENSTQSAVVADREWKALKLYTELEAMRFNNQFSYSFYQDPLIDLNSLMIPPMLVQPLIENAIHHGIRNSTASNNNISIKMEQTTSDIIFTVEDNGIGLEESAKIKNRSAVKSKSMGLATIKERVEIINLMNERESAFFQINSKQPEQGQGTIAVLTLPKMFRTS